jgi:fructose-1,6-bisphosphatase/inositol monophosphatase family enzyme
VLQTPHALAYDHELAVATEAARRAGRLQMERYERLERIIHKGERDVVTEVDTMSEALIIDALRQAYPTDSVLAEESGHTAGNGHQPTAPVEPMGRIWVVDPLDGTVNYANGIPVFCVSVGLAVEGKPVVGVVYDPTRDEIFTAVAGRGAHLDGQQIRHPQKDQLSDLVLSWSSSTGLGPKARQLRRKIRVTRNLGSAALALAYVGNGRFDGFIQIGGLSAWDICAAGLIALEGGAAVTARDGGPWFDIASKSRSIGVIAAAPTHHATILELLS